MRTDHDEPCVLPGQQTMPCCTEGVGEDRGAGVQTLAIAHL